MLKKIGAVALPVIAVAGWLGYSYWPRKSVASDMISAEAEKNRPTGSFRGTGGAMGTWEMPVTGCQSGEKHGFFGVLLFDKADKSRHIRVVKPPQGGTEVYAQLKLGGDPVALKCKTANVNLKRTGASVNFHDELIGSVTLACPNLTGEASFPSCY
jgi:hypothetical protein